MQYTRYTFYLSNKPEHIINLSDVYDLLSELLSERGFDSFEQVDSLLYAYIPSSLEEELKPKDLTSALPFEGISLNWDRELMPDINWNEEWEKNYFQPIIVGDNLCQIRAPFHPSNLNVKSELIINPKMAFGTGNHETTALMMSYILEHNIQGLRVLDMGCGTGILGILALKQGAKDLVAIDIDEWAYLNVLENADLNSVQITQAIQGDASVLIGQAPFDLILANITRNVLMQDMSTYSSVLSKGGRLVLSGFYEDDIPCLTAHAEQFGLKPLGTEFRNRWSRLDLIKD